MMSVKHNKVMSRSTIITISDPLLEPYYITKDDTCFTVHLRVQPKKGHFRTKKEGTEYSKPQGYYVSLEKSLLKISDEQFVTVGEQTKNLNQIIDSLLTTKENIKEFIYEQRK